MLKGRWDFQFCGSGQFLVRFFDSHFKTTVFQFWCLARLASFLQFRLWFSVLSIMMAVFRIFLPNTFYGFSRFTKEVTSRTRAKTGVPRDHLRLEECMTSLVSLASVICVLTAAKQTIKN